jgi:predicted O-linked N-acetylglucosamine transferase (SPINDLY family)
MLTRVGRPDLIADSDDHFVALAVEQAAKAKHQDRAALREAVRNSALCDPRTQARDFERIYRALWRRYCAKAGA